MENIHKLCIKRSNTRERTIHRQAFANRNLSFTFSTYVYICLRERHNICEPPPTKNHESIYTCLFFSCLRNFLVYTIHCCILYRHSFTLCAHWLYYSTIETMRLLAFKFSIILASSSLQQCMQYVKKRFEFPIWCNFDVSIEV